METLKDAVDITYCLNALKDQQPVRRLQALRALGTLPLEATLAVRPLARALKDRDRLVRRAAVDALARTGTAGVPALSAALTDTDCQVRRRAASALGNLGSDARKAMPALVRALQDVDAKVRRLAAHALGLLGQAAGPAIPALTAALHDRDLVCCRLAAWALVQTGPDGIGALEQALFSGDEHARGEAVWALGQARSKARAAIPALAALVGLHVEASRPAPRERLADAADALPATAVVAIEPYGRPKSGLRRCALQALGQIALEVSEARFALEAATQDRDPRVRELAFKALQEVGPDLDRQADIADTIQYREGRPQQAPPSPAASALDRLPPLADSA